MKSMQSNMTGMTKWNPVINVVVVFISIFMMNVNGIIRVADHTKKRLPFKCIESPTTRWAQFSNPRRRFLINTITGKRTKAFSLRRFLLEDSLTYFAGGFFAFSKMFFNTLPPTLHRTIFRSTHSFVRRDGNRIGGRTPLTDFFFSMMKRIGRTKTRTKFLIDSGARGEEFFRTKLTKHKVHLT